MRQGWVATWRTATGLERTFRFMSLNNEIVAREHLKLELRRRELPVPEEFTLRKIGDPPENEDIWDISMLD
jgi:hypothetical protein